MTISTMELFLCFLLTLVLLFLFFYNLPLLIHVKYKKNLPPSPHALPVVGHLHLAKKPLHRTLQSISDKHGPVVLLRFGYRPVLVVSSPSAIEECFVKNDLVFANRPRVMAGEFFGYGFTALGWAPYGHHWRNLRRITTARIFSPSSIQMMSGIRQKEIVGLVHRLLQRCRNDGGDKKVKVDLKYMFLEMSFDVIMRIVAGRRCFGESDKEDDNKRLMEFLKETFIPTMPMALGDFFPFLRRVLVKEERDMVKMQKKRDAFLESLLKEYKSSKHVHSSSTNTATTATISNSSDEQKKQTVMDYLFDLQTEEPEYYTDEIIKGVIVMMLTAGTDTTAVTMEWAMSLLLDHPQVLKKARNEIDSHLHQLNHRGGVPLLQDSDLAKLPYLHQIIQETLRLHPAAPLLIPHAASADCTVGGYHVSRGTIVLANVWAIHRDPKLWVEPTRFIPERFESLEVGVTSYIPFGLGRRRCPGMALAMREMALALGMLIQCFEWEKVEAEPVDMNEKSGLTMPKSKPLEAMCLPRQNMGDLGFQFINK